MIARAFQIALLLSFGTPSAVAAQEGYEKSCQEAYIRLLKRNGVVIEENATLPQEYANPLRSQLDAPDAQGPQTSPNRVAQGALETLKAKLQGSSPIELKRLEDFNSITIKLAPQLKERDLGLVKTSKTPGGIRLDRVLELVGSNGGTSNLIWLDPIGSRKLTIELLSKDSEKLAKTGLQSLLKPERQNKLYVLDSGPWNSKATHKHLEVTIQDANEYLQVLRELTADKGWLLSLPMSEAMEPNVLASLTSALERSGMQWKQLEKELLIVPGDSRSARTLEQITQGPPLSAENLLLKLNAEAQKNNAVSRFRPPDDSWGKSASTSFALAPESLSRTGVRAAFRAHGYTHLKHYTTLDGLETLLKDTDLRSRSYWEKNPASGPNIARNGTGDPSKVYLTLSKDSGIPIVSNDQQFSSFASGVISMADVARHPEARKLYEDMRIAWLYFDDSMLGKGVEYHIGNRHAMYGEFNPGMDFKYGKQGFDPGELRRFVEKEKDHPGEVVFYDSIPLTHLRSIWVFPDYREGLIEKLKSAGIRSYNGTPIEELIQSPKIDLVYKRSADGKFILK